MVHNHAPSLIPFGVAATPLRPVYHMAAFVGQGIPIFEIRDTAGEATDLLIRSPALGRALATSLGDKPAALMRGHGATVVADSLPLVVARSIYLELNAKLQLQALTLAGCRRRGALPQLRRGCCRLDHARRLPTLLAAVAGDSPGQPLSRADFSPPVDSDPPGRISDSETLPLAPCPAYSPQHSSP